MLQINADSKGVEATYTPPAWPARPADTGDVTLKEWLTMQLCRDFTMDPSPLHYQRIVEAIGTNEAHILESDVLARWLARNKGEVNRVAAMFKWEETLNTEIYRAWRWSKQG